MSAVSRRRNSIELGQDFETSLVRLILLFPGVDCNDIPLLMAVASTHSPSVATRYGVTFR